MRSPALSRTVLLFTFALLTAAPAAARLDLPVWTPGSDVTAPFYRGDVLELELRPDAARRALPRGAGPSGARRVGRLGVAAVDAVAAAVGAAGFEPEFRGETPPAPGDDAPDLTAFHLVHLGPGADLESALAAFRALPEVAGADPIAVLAVSQLPNDSLAFATWWLHRTPPPRTDIRAPEAWQVTPGDTSIVVAVLDTGIIPWHPDLGGNGIERGQLWANWIERAGVPGVDDDANGFVDDVAGWDFVDTTAVSQGEDGRFEDNDPNDWGGHGTAVAGVLGAIPGNGIGLAGVVPNVRIMALRMGWYAGGVPPTGQVDMSYAARAIRYATRMGAHVLNCSWQSQNTGGLAAAVSAATRAGVVVVNAAGNGTLNTYLGQRDDVISVAATDTADVVWEFSNKDPWIDLSAPGVNIVSTMFDFPRGATTDSIAGRKPGYRTASGTSFASPMVAGVAALVQAQRRSLGLDPLTPAGMLHRLRETTDDIRAAQFPGITGFGTGRLNAFRALTEPWHSLAVRARARTLGPPVVIPDNTGRSLVVYAMSDRSLVAYDGAGGDTAWVRPLPSLPTGQLAAAEFPQPLGVLIAAGTTAGTVHLVHDDGRPLPGWPVTLQAGINLSSGVAFGDVTGDGVPEVVAGGTAVAGSRVWAIQVPSTEIPTGFPFDPGVAGLSLPALADLDGAPGEEIAFMDGFGALRVVKGDGSELAGFPSATATAPRSPVIARLGPPGTPPSIVVASTNQLTAYAPDGGTRWSVPLNGSPVQDPALGDLDGDGVDEIVLANATPQTIDVRDASGAGFTARPGWPVTVPSPALGPPLVGPIATDGGPSIVFFRTAGLTALDDSANVIPTFPKPGLAGQSPSLAELDGDGATEIAAGAALADSNVHTYDAGPATWAPALAQWPTPRGDLRRSASHATGTPPFFVADRVRPAMVTALTAQALGTTAVEVRYVTTGDDSLAGAATRAILRRAPFPLDDSNWPQGIPVPAPPPRAPGGTDTVRVEPLPEGSTWWFAVRMVDDVGHVGAVSPSDSAALPGLAPAAITDLRALAVTETTVVLTWSATGEDGDQGRPRAYQVSGSTQPLDAGNVDAAPLQVRRPAFHDAGIGETTLVVPLTPGRRWQFAVRGIDRTEARGPISNVVEVFTPVGGAIRGRIGIALAPRPHPAVADVVIDWQGDGAPGGPQWLLVYDLSGRERRRIALGSEPGGSYTWDGRDGDSRLLPAGLYFLRLVSGARHADSRVVFIR
jgi:hypothetical protein